MPPSPMQEAVASVLQILREHRGRVVAITGAGVSTLSGIPDYRSPGRPPHKPITEQQFLASSSARARFWARSSLGWPIMARAHPSAAHVALASLMRDGFVSSLITQNVDRLHTKAGCDGVIELHGSVYDVRCRACGALECRSGVHSRAEAENTEWLSETRAALTGRQGGVGARPDGDFDVNSNAELFLPPPCKSCGERTLAPDVVFFGGSLVPAIAERAAKTVNAAGALLVAGTTLSTLSALRLVRSAAMRKAPVIILNRGVTRADGIAGVTKYDVDVGNTLEDAVGELKGR